MKIRKTDESDLSNVLYVETEAFGYEKEANLVKALLGDSSAMPILSLLAFNDQEEPVGHILFTKVRITGVEDTAAAILAPLAIIPDEQAKGIGGELIKEGLRLLSESGVDLVFVLGHPDYYPRHGFKPDAGALGFEAPYPIPTEHSDAWMVQELNTGVIGTLKGKVICADELNNPEHWRE